jgi:DNA-binding transcriptional ArsR family regulator
MRHNHNTAIQAARKAMATEGTIRALTETFKTLGDPTRLKILTALSREELCVYDIAELLQRTESAISHQLRILRTMRLVKQRKEGKMVYYMLEDEHIEDLIRVAARHYSE